MTPDEIARLPYRPCAGVMLVNSEGHIFVGQRIDNKMEAWQMPQGGVDTGENPRDAAIRELWEETGVTEDKVTIEAETQDWLPYDLPPELVPHIWKGQYRGQKQKWFLMRFHGKDTDVNIATKHAEFSEWRWLPPDELVTRIVPFKREVYAQLLAEFEEYL